jgi:hypothetical protein
MARDVIHNAVKNALVNDGWKITADPYRIKYKTLEVQADLAADRPIAAEKGTEKIVVEVKSFLGRALLHELYTALGQYTFYLRLLEKTAPERKLYLAVSDVVYNDFFQIEAVLMAVQESHLSILVVNIATEEIVRWIN